MTLIINSLNRCLSRHGEWDLEENGNGFCLRTEPGVGRDFGHGNSFGSSPPPQQLVSSEESTQQGQKVQIAVPLGVCDGDGGDYDA